MNGEGAVPSREHFDFQPSIIEIDHTAGGDNGSHYTLCISLGPDELARSFYCKGSTEKWNRTYNNQYLTSVTHSERGDGLDNIRWSSGNMTGSVPILSIRG